MAEREELLVPFALTSSGVEVRPVNAGKVVDYFCPSCHGPLILRIGEIKQPHFAHRVDFEHCEFVHETEEHLRAKWELRDIGKQQRSVFLLRSCSACKEMYKQRWPLDCLDVRLEYLLSSGRIADVVVLNKTGEMRAVIEVFHRHAVDEQKAREFLGVPWAELRAVDILSSDVWQPTQDHLRPMMCHYCKNDPERPERLYAQGWLDVGDGGLPRGLKWL